MSATPDPSVRALQLLLACTGHDPGPLDGLWGPRTRAALVAGQVAAGVAPTGEVDEASLEALRALPRAAVEVLRVGTPLSRPELARALQEGHVRAAGGLPSEKRVRVAVAQLRLEHRADLRAIWDFNLGNLMRGTTWAGPWFVMVSLEQIKGRRVRIRSTWRAAVDAAEGAASYWARLAERYGSVLPYFDRGDPAGAAHALKRARYYTGDESIYARTMEQLYAQP